MSEFMNWLENQDNTDPEKREMAALWEASRIQTPEPPATHEMWADLRMRIAATEAIVKPSWFARFFQTPLPALATTVVLFVGAWITYSQLSPSYLAERGIRSKVVTLDDKSAVTLSAESKLALSMGFNKKNRKVRLDGEAYFEVEKGEKPFVITAGNATIEVVGTKFNVFARNGVVRLDVTEGVVEFSTLRGNKRQTVTLHAGESSVAFGDEHPEEPAPNGLKDQQPSWMKDILQYNDTPMGEVCDALERRFDITIEIQTPEQRAQAVTGIIVTKTTKEAMDSLAFLLNCTYEKTADTYIFNQCQETDE